MDEVDVIVVGAGLAGLVAARDLELGTLARLFGPKAAKPAAFHEQKWADEEWTRGCYGCYLPPGAWTAFGRALRPPVGPLHWAGAEYAERWSGYMDGAVRSGEAAAAAVLRSHRLASPRAGESS